jgi:biotin synthase
MPTGDIREQRSGIDRLAVSDIYHLPLPDLIFNAQSVHRQRHDPHEVQLCTLSNIKSGGCPEDCAYCPQSAHYETGVENDGLLEPSVVEEQARRAKAEGSTRFCMGAAWRQPPEGAQFDSVLALVRTVAGMGMEVCCTLGMLTEDQARNLKAAGLTAYNHNLDTSPEFYPEIITTRTYEDRLTTLERVRAAGLQVCCGGIVGMGESREDRIGLLTTLANLDPPPESVPINGLVRVAGTPLTDQPPFDPIELVRTVATARLIMPDSRVRLAAGRNEMSVELQALCFLAGANSIFAGEKLLTTPNASPHTDHVLFRAIGLSPASA